MSADEIRDARMQARRLRAEACVRARSDWSEALALMGRADRLDAQACLAEIRLPERRAS